MPSAAKTVTAYLGELPEERRRPLLKVLETLRKSVPAGYEESMAHGMICWSIPLSTFPGTYNGEPLCYAALAAQKNHNALYLTGPYMEPALRAELEAAFAEAGQDLDMGKSCLRFKKAEDLPLDAVGRVVARLPPKAFIERYEAIRGTAKGKKR